MIMPGLQRISRNVENRLWNDFRVTAFTFLAILTGLLLFVSAFLQATDTALLSSSRQLELISKYDIYSSVESVVDKTLSSFTGTLAKSADASGHAVTKPSAAGDSRHNLLSAGSEESKSLIRLNVDNIVKGMLLYFKGSSIFLPDIYLHPPVTGEDSSRASTRSYNTLQSGAGCSNQAGQALGSFDAVASIAAAGIDKINLSAIFMYTNRYDITDVFTLIRLLHYIAAKLPPILLAAALACFIAGMLLSRNRRNFAKFLKLAAGSAGFAGITAGCILYYFLNIILPSAINKQMLSFTLSGSTITGYASDLLKPVFLLFILTGLLLPAAFIFPLSLKTDAGLAVVNKIKTCLPDSLKLKKYWHGIALLLTAICATFVIINSAALLGKLEDNGFAGVYGRVAGINPQIEVVPAMNQTVYSLEVKLLDKSSGDPIPGVLIDITGGLTLEGNSVKANKLSDSEGSARFSVHEGYFQVSFPVEMLPFGYKQPDPITVGIKTAGTTTVTIELEKARTAESISVKSITK